MNDKAFDALRNEHRRELLLALLEHNPQTVPKTNPDMGKMVIADADQQLHIAMYHRHLPRLEEHGYIRWDSTAQEVVKGPEFADIRPLLECIDEYESR